MILLGHRRSFQLRVHRLSFEDRRAQTRPVASFPDRSPLLDCLFAVPSGRLRVHPLASFSLISAFDLVVTRQRSLVLEVRGTLREVLVPLLVLALVVLLTEQTPVPALAPVRPT